MSSTQSVGSPAASCRKSRRSRFPNEGRVPSVQPISKPSQAVMAMSEDDLPEVTARDAIQIAQRALAKANEIESAYEQLESDYEDLQERMTELELQHSGRAENRDYPSLTLDEKIGMVREHGFKKATSSNGYAKLDYKGVTWGVFDGDPTAKHCYKLLRLAAEGAEGFEFQDPDGDSKHLRVDAQAAKQNAAFFTDNNGVTEVRGR